ncbi:GNAT family N-acetyltransferase [Pseudomonas cichorii]|uniref:GNAT family N-acetyltransferase n=1 Tax=Pseudomonas cichorii TaxID=36746 RepID=UPI001C89AD8B|nr:GNAT family N-acetyltransferase [Pseudomonas cichorii]MBX8487244.1 GNAT family N-acetyltransferase [Pseudomonas cichorii]
MRRDLGQPVPEPHWPADIRPIPFSLDQALEIHRLLSLAYRDGSGSVPDFSHWVNAFEHDPEFDTGLCFVAVDDQGAVGVITCWTSAFIKDLVVHPRARRQGVAMALLTRLFSHLRQRGEPRVDLLVMENNLMARQLYEKMDMSYVRRSAIEET